MHSVLDLLFGEGAEEVDLLGAGGPPLVIRLERRLEVRLDVHVERLRLQLAVRRVVHTRDRLPLAQVVQVLRQLGELRTRALLLSDLLLTLALLVVGVEEFTDFLVLVLDVLQILFACEEIMLVLSAVVTSVAAQTRITHTSLLTTSVLWWLVA